MGKVRRANFLKLSYVLEYKIAYKEVVRLSEQPKRLTWNSERRRIHNRNKKEMREKMGPRLQYIATRLDGDPGAYSLGESGLTGSVSATFDEAEEQLNEPLDEIRDLVEESLTEFFDRDDLDDLKGRVLDGVRVHAEALKGAYRNYDHDYTEDHEDELKEVNDQITHYRGDVRRGAEDLRSRVDELQKSALDDARGDPELDKFRDELYQVDTGDDEFEEFGAPDKAAVIRDLIETLKRELEG